MRHLDARVGDIVQLTGGGPEMRVFATDGDGSNLHCEWKGEDGRMEATFDPALVTLVSKRGVTAKVEADDVEIPEERT